MKSMNMYIDQIVTEMTLFDDDVNMLFFDVVMEEEVAKNTTQASKEEPGMVDKMIDTVKKLFIRLNGLIQKNFLKFKNFMMKVAESDQGFENEFRKAFKAKKPLTAIKLVTYDYNPNILDAELLNINKVIQGLFNGMVNKTSYTALSDTTTANDMDRSPEEIYQMIFKELSCPGDVKDINTYFIHIKNKFRVDKKEILFKSSQTQEYYQMTKQHSMLMEKIKKSEGVVSNQVATMKSNLHNTILNKQSRAEVKKRAVKQCKNLTHIMNFYIRFVDIYMQLNLERLFTYRTVLKKLYSF